MSDIVEAWKWRDPGEIIEALLRESERREGRVSAMTAALDDAAMRMLSLRPGASVRREARDRYYTQARRLHVKQVMKGER